MVCKPVGKLSEAVSLSSLYQPACLSSYLSVRKKTDIYSDKIGTVVEFFIFLITIVGRMKMNMWRITDENRDSPFIFHHKMLSFSYPFSRIPQQMNGTRFFKEMWDQILITVGTAKDLLNIKSFHAFNEQWGCKIMLIAFVVKYSHQLLVNRLVNFAFIRIDSCISGKSKRWFTEILNQSSLLPMFDNFVWSEYLRIVGTTLLI